MLSLCFVPDFKDTAHTVGVESSLHMQSKTGRVYLAAKAIMQYYNVCRIPHFGKC